MDELENPNGDLGLREGRLTKARRGGGVSQELWSKQGDEAVGVMMVVEVTGGEGGQRLTVQGVRGGGACLDDIPFLELEFHFSSNVLLGGGDKSADSVAQRGEPFPFVYDLCQLIAHVLLHFHSCPV